VGFTVHEKIKFLLTPIRKVRILPKLEYGQQHYLRFVVPNLIKSENKFGKYLLLNQTYDDTSTSIRVFFIVK
jgi:hypothetical protein